MINEIYIEIENFLGQKNKFIHDQGCDFSRLLLLVVKAFRLILICYIWIFSVYFFPAFKHEVFSKWLSLQILYIQLKYLELTCFGSSKMIMKTSVPKEESKS